MKLQFGNIVTGARGRFGGMVLSANASGPYAKNFAPAVRRETSAQLRARSSMASKGAPWRALTAAQRTAWFTYSQQPPQQKLDSLGNPYFLNGWQWYVSCNTLLDLAARPNIIAPPVLGVPGVATVGALTITSPGTAGNQLVITPASFGADDLILYLNFSRSDSAPVMSDRNFRFVLAVQNGSLASPINLGNLQPIFGTIQAGTYWEARVYRQSAEGRRGIFVTSSVVAV